MSCRSWKNVNLCKMAESNSELRSDYTILWTYLHFLRCIISILPFYHLDTNFIFGIEKKNWCTLICAFFSERYFDHVWPAVLYLALSRTDKRAHDSKYMNEVYKVFPPMKIIGGGMYLQREVAKYWMSSSLHQEQEPPATQDVTNTGMYNVHYPNVIRTEFCFILVS